MYGKIKNKISIKGLCFTRKILVSIQVVSLEKRELCQRIILLFRDTRTNYYSFCVFKRFPLRKIIFRILFKLINHRIESMKLSLISKISSCHKKFSSIFIFILMLSEGCCMLAFHVSNDFHWKFVPFSFVLTFLCRVLPMANIHE